MTRATAPRSEAAAPGCPAGSASSVDPASSQDARPAARDLVPVSSASRPATRGEVRVRLKARNRCSVASLLPKRLMEKYGAVAGLSASAPSAITVRSIDSCSATAALFVPTIAPRRCSSARSDSGRVSPASARALLAAARKYWVAVGRYL